MQRLSFATLDRLTPAFAPPLDPKGIGVGIVHLGIGAFHRAHQAVYTQGAMAATGDDRWGICGVTQRSTAVQDALRPQDGLYSLIQRGADGVSLSVQVAVREILFAQNETADIAARLAAPDTQVVTLTVTEKGYRHNAADGRLRRDDPELRADLAGSVPKTVIGQLARGLQERGRRGSGPITIVCCDNLMSNGKVLRALVEDFCALLPQREGTELAEWVTAHVRFPSTMVDRIVPASTASDRALAASELGLRDDGVVTTEPFSQWVIEDCFAADRPAWEEAGATLTADVAPYEQMKLRLLNASHLALAYLGSLSGQRSISDAIGREDLARVVRGLMDADMSPTLSVPDGFDLEGYKESLLERFANPALRHETRQVAMDGSQKLPQRLLQPIRAQLAVGAQPRFACLALAAWMRYVTAERDEKGADIKVDDPLAEDIARVRASGVSPAAVVDALLKIRAIFPEDLASDQVLRELTTESLTAMTRGGVAAATSAILN
jgi:fructuronate reductase